MKDKVIAIAVITILCVGTLTGVLYMAFNSTNKDQEDTCQEFCNCSVTKDCPYTFDYSKVKYCECGE